MLWEHSAHIDCRGITIGEHLAARAFSHRAIPLAASLTARLVAKILDPHRVEGTIWSLPGATARIGLGFRVAEILGFRS